MNTPEIVIDRLGLHSHAEKNLVAVNSLTKNQSLFVPNPIIMNDEEMRVWIGIVRRYCKEIQENKFRVIMGTNAVRIVCL